MGGGLGGWLVLGFEGCESPFDVHFLELYLAHSTDMYEEIRFMFNSQDYHLAVVILDKGRQRNFISYFFGTYRRS